MGVGDVMRNDIKKETDAAPFVAVEVDETTGVTDKAQISVILRYVAKNEAGCEVCRKNWLFRLMTERL